MPRTPDIRLSPESQSGSQLLRTPTWLEFAQQVEAICTNNSGTPAVAALAPLFYNYMAVSSIDD